MSHNEGQTAVRTGKVRAAVSTWMEAAGWVVTVLVVGATLASVVMMARGYRVVAVTSGSMRPTYDVGDAVLVKPGITDGIEVGDIVVFNTGRGAQMTIHRVVGVRQRFNGPVYQTKGDANSHPDEHLLPENELQAKGFWSIPYAGYLAHVMSASLSRMVFIGLLLLIVGREVLMIFRIRRRLKRRTAAA